VCSHVIGWKTAEDLIVGFLRAGMIVAVFFGSPEMEWQCVVVDVSNIATLLRLVPGNMLTVPVVRYLANIKEETLK
jgi:hypothetical protein